MIILQKHNVNAFFLSFLLVNISWSINNRFQTQKKVVQEVKFGALIQMHRNLVSKSVLEKAKNNTFSWLYTGT